MLFQSVHQTGEKLVLDTAMKNICLLLQAWCTLMTGLKCRDHLYHVQITHCCITGISKTFFTSACSVMGQGIQLSAAFLTGYGAYSNQKFHVFLEDTLNSIPFTYLFSDYKKRQLSGFWWWKIKNLFSLSKVVSSIKVLLHIKSMYEVTFPMLLKNWMPYSLDYTS